MVSRCRFAAVQPGQSESAQPGWGSPAAAGAQRRLTVSSTGHGVFQGISPEKFDPINFATTDPINFANNLAILLRKSIGFE